MYSGIEVPEKMNELRNNYVVTDRFYLAIVKKHYPTAATKFATDRRLALCYERTASEQAK